MPALLKLDRFSVSLLLYKKKSKHHCNSLHQYVSKPPAETAFACFLLQPSELLKGEETLGRRIQTKTKF